MTLLIDDQLLGDLLRGGRSPDPPQPVYTTGYWYVRLCQAVLRSADRSGVLSRPFRALTPPQHELAVRRLLELPQAVGLLSLRDLAPTMGTLRHTHSLNILSLEALAAAVHLDAHVRLSAPSPNLEAALAAERRPVTVTPQRPNL